MMFKKYKKFFGIPLDRLPFELPDKKDAEKRIGGRVLRKKSQIKKQMEENQRHNLKEILEEISEKFSVSVTNPNRQVRPMKVGLFEYLDSVYEDLASKIPMKVERKKGLSLPVVEYGYENFDPAEHDASEINFNRIVVDSASPFKERLGNINFQVPEHYYRLPVPYSNAKGSFPDICLIIDSSFSMEKGGDSSLIPWGDESSYHYALLGLYGVIKDLESEGIASSLLWNMIDFSNSTNASGWKRYSEIGELKKHALTPQFLISRFGGTKIEVDVLDRELNREPSLVMMLSDGRIHNWAGIKDDMRHIVEMNYTSFIQIGGETKVGRDMQEYGAAVYTVKNKEGLSKLLIDLTREVRRYS